MGNAISRRSARPTSNVPSAFRQPPRRSVLERLWIDLGGDKPAEPSLDWILASVADEARNEAITLFRAHGLHEDSLICRSFADGWVRDQVMAMQWLLSRDEVKRPGCPGGDTVLCIAAFVQSAIEQRRDPAARPHTIAKRVARALGPGLTPGAVARATEAGRRRLSQILVAPETDPLSEAGKLCAVILHRNIRNWLEAENCRRAA